MGWFRMEYGEIVARADKLKVGAVWLSGLSWLDRQNPLWMRKGHIYLVCPNRSLDGDVLIYMK